MVPCVSADGSVCVCWSILPVSGTTDKTLSLHVHSVNKYAESSSLHLCVMDDRTKLKANNLLMPVKLSCGKVMCF